MFALLIFSSLTLSLSLPIVVSNTENESVPLALFGRQLPECMNVTRYRTVQGIFLRCLATIFACTWVAIHPNLPGPWDSGRSKLKRKVVTAIYAVLAPELMAMWALRQRMAARRIALTFNTKYLGAGTPPVVPWYTSILKIPKGCWAAILDTAGEWWKGPDKEAREVWTLTHGFFVQMGGFMLCEGNTPVRVLEFDELVEMIDRGSVRAPKITEKEINDKSKGDLLTKLLIVLQTTWFSFQCIARWTLDLSVTKLEVATLAFAALNVVTYGLWWKKPQSVEAAVHVQLEYTATTVGDCSSIGGETVETEGPQESWITGKLREAARLGWIGWTIEVPSALVEALRRPIRKMSYSWSIPRGSLRMPMFYADGLERQAYIPIMTTGVLFGSFHLIPWSSTFPSTSELWLWRCSALLITTLPLLLILNYLHLRLQASYSALFWVYYRTLPLYYFARLTLLVLALTTLRDLPPEAYAAIEWTTFIPHF